MHHQTGQINLDVLGSMWSPALTLLKAVLSICSLLIAPQFVGSCWANKDVPSSQGGFNATMQDQIALGLTDRPAWEEEAHRWVQSILSPREPRRR